MMFAASRRLRQLSKAYFYYTLKIKIRDNYAKCK